MKEWVLKCADNPVRLLAVGDIMLDQYISGGINRISPEAPVPVLSHNNSRSVPGGVGNVAKNLAGLNSRVTCLGLGNDDVAGNEIQNLLSEVGIETHLFSYGERPTTRKTRFVSGHQQLLRLDEEFSDPLTRDQAQKLIADISDSVDWSSFQGLIISDYNKGFCHPDICSYIIQQGEKYNIPVIVDPKGTQWDKYKGAFCVTPNVKELSLLCGRTLSNEDRDIIKAASEIRKKFSLKNLLVTRSEKGMSLFLESGEVVHLPTKAREVFDVSGAGDTVAATLLRFLAQGASLADSAALANHAAALVVAHWGTTAIDIEELKNSLEDQGDHPLIRLLSQERLSGVVQQLKKQKKRIVFTNGCFDILHRGHISYLQQAREKGDCLILGLNSDSSVKKLKGPVRPINNEESRAHMLLALRYVDYVVVFDQETPYELIKAIAPDVLVKGGDYEIENIVGREFAGETLTIPFVEGFSTTGIIEKIGG